MENEVNKKEFAQVDAPGIEENESDLFSRLTSDWRNIALVVAGAIVVILLLMRLTAVPGGETVAQVGGKTITEKNVVDELKHQAGDQVLMQMVSDELIQNYARQKNVSVSEDDIDKFIKFQQATFEMRGETIDKWLEQRGQTMADFRRLLKMTILQIKLIVPEEDIKAALAKFANKLDLPLRYRFRDFAYISEADAKKALVSFKKPDGLQDGAATAVNRKTAQDIQTIAANNLETRFPTAYTALKSLKAGGFSAPFDTKTNGFHIMQLVEIVPEEKATLENRSTIIGQQLISEDRKKYQMKIEAIKADALHKVDTQIMSTDYGKAHQMLQDMLLHNPNVNTVPSEPGASKNSGAPSGTHPLLTPRKRIANPPTGPGTPAPPDGQ